VIPKGAVEGEAGAILWGVLQGELTVHNIRNSNLLLIFFLSKELVNSLSLSLSLSLSFSLSLPLSISLSLSLPLCLSHILAFSVYFPFCFSS
jgi:hypothetical protein